MQNVELKIRQKNKSTPWGIFSAASILYNQLKKSILPTLFEAFLNIRQGYGMLLYTAGMSTLFTTSQIVA